MPPLSPAVIQFTRFFAHARLPVPGGGPDELRVYGRPPAGFRDPHFATRFMDPPDPVRSMMMGGEGCTCLRACPRPLPL